MLYLSGLCALSVASKIFLFRLCHLLKTCVSHNLGWSQMIMISLILGDLQFDNILVLDNFKFNRTNEETDDGMPNHQPELDLETAFLPGNVTVSLINGGNFEDLLNDMCLINVKCFIPRNLTVQGNITTNDSYTDFLNNLKYPENFLFLDSNPYVNITGLKKFSLLFANEILTRGVIDKVNTSKVITLSGNQNISGKIAFEDLQLIEAINVTGNITGDEMDKFLSNPRLNETDVINVNMIFKNIEVEGNVFIGNNFNNDNFNETLHDLVYKDENEVEILEMKEFPQGIQIEDLIIESSMINKIDLKDLVTQDTDQEFFGISVLNGHVSIKNLIVNGTFDGYDISEFDESLVKLTGEQFIESTLIFEDKLIVDSLEISEKLNEYKAEDYIYANGDNQIDWNVQLEDIQVENILIEGHFLGNIAENNLTTITNILRYTEDQTIKVPFEIRSAEVDTLEVNQINGFDFRDTFNEDTNQEKLVEKINKGLVLVGNLIVNGPLKIERVDDLLMSRVLQNPFKDGSYKKNLIVEGDVYFKELNIQKLSGVTWETLLNLLIFKNETNVKLSGTKKFLNDFTVHKLIEANEINGVHIGNILTTTGEQELLGSILIEGDVVFQTLDVNENVNQVPMKHILNNLNINNNIYTVNGDALFKRLQYIDDLVLKGNVNNKNPEEIIDQIAYLDEDIVLTNLVKFYEPVHILGNTSVNTYNGKSFKNLFSEIVYIDKPATINTKIVFTEPIFLSERLQIQGNLDTELLFGLNTSEWIEKAIFVDKGFIEGMFFFDHITMNEKLVVEFINTHNMRSVIDLSRNEFLNDMKFGRISVVNDIPVGNLVNGYKMADEVIKTLMVDGEQVIDSNIIFKNTILIRENLTVDTINKHNASKLVPIKIDQNLSSPFHFKNKCSITANLEVHGLFNGMNTTNFNNLRSISPEIQEINAEWNVLNNLTFLDVSKGGDSIGNLNFTFLAEEVQQRRNYKYQTEGGIIETYNDICTDIKHLQQVAQNQLFKFKYFENLQEITLPEKLSNFFYFEFFKKQYLWINSENCMSHIFEFNASMFYPLNLQILTGQVEQVVPVVRNNSTYLVTRGSDDCNVGGTIIWEFKDNLLELKFAMENLELIQDSLVPGTFYGLDREGVTEYKIMNTGYIKYRQWRTFETNSAFFPRGLSGTGLALRTGRKIIFLDRSDPVTEEREELDSNSEEILKGTVTIKPSTAIPGRSSMDLVIINVGTKITKKTFLAVANLVKTTVEGYSNVIKIYDDPLKSGVFQEIKCYKPSSLISIEFEQGETLLVFLEDNKLLQIYEYKGIEGFKHRTSAKLEGTKLLSMTLPLEPYRNPRKALGVMNGNKITIIQAVMTGSRLEDEFSCGL